MTGDILIDKFKAVQPNAVSWKRSIYNFTDTAKVKIPAVSYIRKEGEQYERVKTGNVLEEGMPVEISVGYNGRNRTRFKGFLSRINYSIPLELELEGYAYQLRKKLNFTRSYKNTTVKNILQDLVEGTDILLSDAIPSVPLEKAVFNNANGIQVLEWFKNQCLLTVYFRLNTLYVGLEQGEPVGNVKLKLGWNTVSDSELKFNSKKEFADVKINVVTSQKGGKKKRKSSSGLQVKDSSVKEFKTVIKDDDALQKLADEERRKFVNKGYEGSVKLFLEPFFEFGYSAEISDDTYPDRTGKYFIAEEEGEFGPSGGRVKAVISNAL